MFEGEIQKRMKNTIDTCALIFSIEEVSLKNQFPLINLNFIMIDRMKSFKKKITISSEIFPLSHVPIRNENPPINQKKTILI